MTRWQAKLNDAEKRKAALSRNQAIREQWLHGDALETGRQSEPVPKVSRGILFNLLAWIWPF